MGTQLIIVLLLLFIAIILFITNKIRMDVVAILAILSLYLTGILNITEALNGFSQPNVILIAALFIIGEGLVRTGIAHKVGDWLVRTAGNSEAKMLVLLMVCVMGLGAVVSSTGVVAIFIPIVLSVCRKMKVSPSKFMMPLSFAGLLSGMGTLVATPPNLMVDAELRSKGFDGFGFFDITPIGVVLLVVGILYMLLAKNWITVKELDEDMSASTMNDMYDKYGLNGTTYMFKIPENSPMTHKTSEELSLRSKYGVHIIGVERVRKFGQRSMLIPEGSMEFKGNDVILLFKTSADVDLERFISDQKLAKLSFKTDYLADHTKDIGMAEITFSPNSDMLGKTIIEMTFRNNLRLSAISLMRKGVVLGGNLYITKIELGDTLLVVGDWENIRKMQSYRDVIVLNYPAELEDIAPASSQAPFALFSVVVMVLLMVFGVVENVIAVFIACLLMGLFKCVDMNSAYRSIHWPSLILIIGMLPFATALQKTGGIDLVVNILNNSFGGYGPRVMLVCLFVLTSVTGLFISNTATAVLIAPVAVAIAAQMGVSVYPFAMVVMIAASAAFMTPVSSPVNTLVLAPGGYKFTDFMKIGIPFTFIVLIISVILIPILFPLYP